MLSFHSIIKYIWDVKKGLRQSFRLSSDLNNKLIERQKRGQIVLLIGLIKGINSGFILKTYKYLR